MELNSNLRRIEWVLGANQSFKPFTVYLFYVYLMQVKFSPTKTHEMASGSTVCIHLFPQIIIKVDRANSLNVCSQKMHQAKFF